MQAEEQYKHAVLSFSDNLYQFVCLSCMDVSVAEEITRDIFEKLSTQDLKESAIRLWLFKTAYTLISNDIRIKKGIRDHLGVRSEEMTSIPEKTTQEYIRSIYDGCTLTEKNALLLRDIEHFSILETAEIMGLSEDQVEQILFKTRSKIKDVLLKHQP